jgi:hypothetical protein
LYAIPADDLEAKSHEAQRIHKALIKEFTKLNSNSGSIRSQLSIEYEISLVELHQWLNENCFTDMAEQFKPIVSLSQSETNDSKSRLNESEYWNKLEKIAVKAIDEYPNWAKDKKKIRKTGNLQSWLEENICNEQRAEPEIIKRILTDIYNI